MDLVGSTSDFFETQVKSSFLTTVAPAADNSAAVKESSGKTNLSQDPASTVVSLGNNVVNNVGLYDNQGSFSPVNGPSNADEDINSNSSFSPKAAPNSSEKQSLNAEKSSSGEVINSANQQNSADSSRFQANGNVNSQEEGNSRQQNAQSITNEETEQSNPTANQNNVVNVPSGQHSNVTASSNNGNGVAVINNTPAPRNVFALNSPIGGAQQTPVVNGANSNNDTQGNNSNAVPANNSNSQNNTISSDNPAQNAATAKLLSAVLKQL